MFPPAKLTILWTVLSAVACLSVWPCLGQESPTLQGGIARSTSLTSLDPRLAPGNVFNQKEADALMPKSNSDDKWRKLPAWYAGRWQKNQTLIKSVIDEKSGTEIESNRVVAAHTGGLSGNYIDRSGQVWEHEQSGYWSAVDGDKYTQKRFVIKRTPIVTSDTQCQFKLHQILFTIDKRTKKIISCEQEVTESSIYPVSPSETRSITIQRHFDWEGNPTTTSEGISRANKTANLVPDPTWTTLAGKPLFPLFVQYLQDRGMSDLIPDPPGDLRPVVRP